jgi:drug/metabolite transporter (DMT)-like permease
LDTVKKEIPQRTVYFGLLLTGVLWSTSGLLIKLLPWNPMAIASLRSLFAVLTMLIYMRKKIIINKRTVFGALPLTIGMCLFIMANKLTTAANAIMLEYTSPVLTLVISAILTHSRIKKREILVVTIAMVGIALFFVEKASAGGMLGNILALVAGMSYAVMYYFNATYGKEAMHSMVLGHIFCFLIGLPFVFTEQLQITWVSAGTIVLMGVFQLGIPSILFASLMKHTTPFKGVIITMIEPLINPVWVLIFAGEVPSVLAVIGGLIVIAAIVINIMPQKANLQPVKYSKSEISN